MKRCAAEAGLDSAMLTLDDVPDAYEQLDQYLAKCKKSFLEQGGSFVFHIDELATDEGLAKMEGAFQASGVVCVIGFENNDSLAMARAAVSKAAAEMAAGRVSEEEITSWLLDVRNFDSETRRARCPMHPRTDEEEPGSCDWCRNGAVFGNCAFAYLFPQWRPLASTLKGYVEGNEVPMMHQPMYAGIVYWLAAHPKLANLLLRFGAHDGRPRMVSWDSAKYINRAHAGTKKEFTKVHTDFYDSPVHRRQMCVEFSERRANDKSARQLGYVPFTAMASSLLAQINGRGGRRGFVGMHKDARLVAIMHKHAVSFAGAHLACWAEGVVHFEAMFASDTADPPPGTLTRYASDKLPRGPRETLRMVCGTHDAVGSRLLRSHLAAYALGGFVPDAYHTKAYKNTAVGSMMFSAKTTQYKKERKVLEPEKRAFTRVDATIDPNGVELPPVPSLVKHLMGLPDTQQ